MEMSSADYARGCLLRILAQPSRYDQGTWQTVDTRDVRFGSSKEVEVSCPTTGCVAGTAAMLAGDRGLASKGWTATRNGRRVYEINTVITEAGKKIGVRDRGAALLGLSSTESSWLFSGGRTLPEVVNALIELSENKPLSMRGQCDMTREEQTALMNYRVPPQVKRQHTPAEPAVPTKHAAKVHGG